MSTYYTNDGGPAFPIPMDDMGTLTSANSGMSLRDYFAAQAIQSIVLATSQGLHRKGIPADVDGLELGMAQDAYRIADAMLEARKQKEAE